MSNKGITINTRSGGQIVFKLKEFDNEVEVEDLLKIDYSCIFAEISTFPVLLNRMGILLADCEQALRLSEINLKVFEKKSRNRFRVGFEESGKKWVKDMIDDEVEKDPTYIAKLTKHYTVQKERDYVNSVFWAMKNKSELLVKLSLTIKQGDMESFLIENEFRNFNGVDILFRKPLIE
jgi:hypothetical protein